MKIVKATPEYTGAALTFALLSVNAFSSNDSQILYTALHFELQ